LQETGDLIIPIQQGRFRPEAIHAELGEIVSGDNPGRQDPQEISLFKSVGNAVQDVAAAQAIVCYWQEGRVKLL
jgi:ornithine cyclodeaminase